MASEIYASVIKARKTGKTEAPRHTWQEAVLKWFAEKGESSDHISKLKQIDKFIGNKFLDEISRQDLEDIKDFICKTRKPTTANRYLALIRAIMMKCHKEWEDTVNAKPVAWLLRVPRFPMSPENKGGIALTHEEVDKLASLLPSPEKELVIFLAYTGIRLSNALNMKPDWFNGKLMTIPAKEAKGKHPITIVLGDKAYPALEKYPFSLRRKVWDKARKELGYPELRIHDLRHTFASWAAHNGATDAQLQQLGGWKSRAMVDRYAHLNTESVKDVVESINRGAYGEQSVENIH